MSQIQQPSSCIHNGTIPIHYEHDGKIYHKLSCKNCLKLIKSFSTYKLIDKSPLPNLEITF